MTDCGEAENKPGSSYTVAGEAYNPNDHFYQDRFLFECDNDNTRTGETGGVGDRTEGPYNVICQNTGVWNFGSLQCSGESVYGCTCCQIEISYALLFLGDNIEI